MSEDVPLPKVNQRYKDDHGALVTVTSVEEIWVVFMRDGYPHYCLISLALTISFLDLPLYFQTSVIT
ncbi:TPA: DUF4222 domain-containing protein [Escherichia coli]|uniref:DUF4222 domain-containing protein n=1 Tax=Escherichia coli TaxID=562 RepID=UPI001073B00C|nr:DUF4222 domain-containing protein [Escherichia coli]EFI5429913.1 DUF4222 domain-containing protein [Escherichia coli]EIC2998466.1 DUF4222 domain-containing protein [Escherichia coli]EKM8846266.1 DUF4222 domain-containing protein [Escherichia coli]ELG6348202.1 DUF4222 domain-containing protein [Escherichia coli]ELR9339826.1 DUF4222 domain-containing protein [Escherichia coli]